jgi:hypothetical protein
MLDDSHKRLRTPSTLPKPTVVNLRPTPKKHVSPADRLAAAREKTSIYAISQQSDMTDSEREKYRKELKERFSGPAARPMPVTLTGLTSLANERIEDAIARGQFKNLPRGKGVNVERDHVANSPFLDTTEYFMNKIIQKQEIVPPWIEKQQELVKAVNSFRGRLRSDWRRHAARMISARGGTVQEQVRRAKAYAAAEERVNPRPKRRVENFSAIALDGTLTTVTVEERIAAGVMSVVEAPSKGRQEQEQEQVEIKVTEQPAADAPLTTTPSEAPSTSTTSSTLDPSTASPSIPKPTPIPLVPPYRDPSWQSTELAYHNLAISNLNALTRSYNLMSPKIAQKPYFSLQRELDRCFSDVAPQIADEILSRSRQRPARVEVVGHKEGGVLERFGEEWKGHVGRVRDEGKEKGYGFKEFWRDLFARSSGDGGRRREVV